jgi:hypothetical protein
MSQVPFLSQTGWWTSGGVQPQVPVRMSRVPFLSQIGWSVS